MFCEDIRAPARVVTMKTSNSIFGSSHVSEISIHISSWSVHAPGCISQEGTAALTVINQRLTHPVIGNTACLGAVTQPQTSLFIQSLSSFEKSACFDGSKAGGCCCGSSVRVCVAWLNPTRSHQTLLVCSIRSHQTLPA